MNVSRMTSARMTLVSTFGAAGLLAGALTPAAALPMLGAGATAAPAATQAEPAYYYYRRRYGYYRPYRVYRPYGYYRPYYRPYYYRPGIGIGVGGFGVRLF